MESRRESRREREVGGKVGIVEANQIGHRTFPTLRKVLSEKDPPMNSRLAHNIKAESHVKSYIVAP